MRTQEHRADQKRERPHRCPRHHCFTRIFDD